MNWPRSRGSCASTLPQRCLYQQLRGEGYSGIASFRIDPESGAVTQIGEVEREADACYVSTDRGGRFLLAAYLLAGMVTVHPIAGSDTSGHLSTYRINAQGRLEALQVYDLGMWVAWMLPVKFP